MEICNNDLKYGYGSAYWKWTKLENDLLELEIQTNSKYTLNKKKSKEKELKLSIKD